MHIKSFLIFFGVFFGFSVMANEPGKFLSTKTKIINEKKAILELTNLRGESISFDVLYFSEPFIYFSVTDSYGNSLDRIYKSGHRRPEVVRLLPGDKFEFEIDLEKRFESLDEYKKDRCLVFYWFTSVLIKEYESKFFLGDLMSLNC